MRLLPLAAFLVLSGCSVSPVPELRDALDRPAPQGKVDAVESLCALDSRESAEALIHAFKHDLAPREATASALVIRGRRWFAKTRHKRKKGEPHTNRVIMGMGEIAAGSNVDADLRAKAVWVMAEIGDRKADAEIKAAHTDDSTAVAREVAISREKLGFIRGENKWRPECMADGSTLSSYDPRARGHVPEGGTP
jgi:hypothetical protein